MNYEQNWRKGARISAIAVSLILVFVAPPAVLAQEEELPMETHDGLVLLPDREVAAAYIDPQADLGVYNKIMILDCYVAFKKDWQREHKRTGSNISVSSAEMEKIKAAVAELFREVFTEELGTNGGYEIVEAAGDDVLLVRPAIIDLDITAPDTASAGRSSTYTASSGAATIYIELYDSVSGDILARAADRKSQEVRADILHTPIASPIERMPSGCSLPGRICYGQGSTNTMASSADDKNQGSPVYV